MAKKSTASPARAPGKSRGQKGRIHPVIIYPFRQPTDCSDLRPLYEMEDNGAFLDFRKQVVAKHSEILDAWCVDTCQMWYTGLGAAFERGRPDDVYWLIPGDF